MSAHPTCARCGVGTGPMVYEQGLGYYVHRTYEDCVRANSDSFTITNKFPGAQSFSMGPAINFDLLTPDQLLTGERMNLDTARLHRRALAVPSLEPYHQRYRDAMNDALTRAGLLRREIERRAMRGDREALNALVGDL